MAFKSLIGAACAGLMLISFSANAALISRLGGLAYYDDVADLTWRANAIGDPVLYSSYPLRRWEAAKAWAADLVVGGNDNWRLPTADAQCGIGYNCVNGELGNMFYNVLGGTAGVPLSTSHNSNFDLFSNIQSRQYWSSTDNLNQQNVAWVFYMGDGKQLTRGTFEYVNTWAVHSGDVSAVPLPAAAWLFISAIAGLASAKRLSRSKASA